MRSTVFLPLLAAIALAGSAFATPPLRMDSQGVVQAKALNATDGGVHAGAGLSTFTGGVGGFNAPSIVPAAPTVTSNVTLDGGGSTTYTYAITACSTATCSFGSESILSPTGSTTTSIATPTATYPNQIVIPATVGAVAFGVWETVPTGARMGLLAVVAQTACSNAGDYCGATFLDTGAALISDLNTGLAGNGDAGPVNDQSGEVSATNLFANSRPASIVSGVNGSVPTAQQYCEIFAYQISSGEAATHDAGFGRAFNVAPTTNIQISVVPGSTDGGGLVPKSDSISIATTGFTYTTAANVTEQLAVQICGN